MAYSKLTLNRETQVYEGTETEWSHKNPGTKETRPIYVRDLWGNPGYWKLAIARTPGTSYWQNSWGNCSLGASNRIYARFENDGQELYTQLRQAYDAICDEKAIQARATRAKNAAKPKVAPQPVVVRQPKAKKPEKVAVSFEVSHKTPPPFLVFWPWAGVPGSWAQAH